MSGSIYRVYPHLNRGFWKFFLLGIITLGIYDIVVLTDAGHEINEIRAGKDRPLPNFVLVFFVGILSLGLLWLIYVCRLSGQVGREARRRNLSQHPTSAASFALWSTLGLLLIVGPAVALHRLFVCLNDVEKDVNDEIVKHASLPEAKSHEKAFPAHAVETAMASSVSPSDTPTDEARSGKIYHITPRQDDGLWQVRFVRGSKAVKLFTTQKEAIDYAQKLADSQGVSIRVHNRKGKIRRK